MHLGRTRVSQSLFLFFSFLSFFLKYFSIFLQNHTILFLFLFYFFIIIIIFIWMATSINGKTVHCTKAILTSKVGGPRKQKASCRDKKFHAVFMRQEFFYLVQNKKHVRGSPCSALTNVKFFFMEYGVFFGLVTGRYSF